MTAIDKVCAENDVAIWKVWKKIFREEGVTVIDDDSGIADTKLISADEAKEAIKKCTVEAIKGDSGQIIEVGMTPEGWGAAYANLIQTDPINETLTTQDGEPVQITISLVKGKAPFFYTRIYIPEAVCSEVKWFANSEINYTHRGQLCVLLPRSRDLALGRFDLSGRYGYVKSLKVIRRAVSENWILVEVGEWL